MYSGTLLTNKSGAVIGAHQKINRISRRFLRDMAGSAFFPTTRQILNFEGLGGPDGIKSKSPASDEPWHFYDPFDPEDSDLLDLVEDHYRELVSALKRKDQQKSAFEAAWLAHALVDGLTPAHHYPYEEELEKLRGEDKATRDSLKRKIVIPGDTKTKLIRNNWKMWGPKGLLLTHFWFEFGVALIMAPMRFHLCRPTKYDIKTVETIGIGEFFRRRAREIAMMNMYERYYQRGWTAKLARDVRDELVPALIKTVSLAWYSAVRESGQPATRETK